MLLAASALPAAGAQPADCPDPLDTERFASASDYSKNDNFAPAKAQLQTIIGRDKQRVRLVNAAYCVVFLISPICATQVPGEFNLGDPLAVNGRCQKRCLPVALVCEAFGEYQHALKHFEAYQLTEIDWCLYHDLRKVHPPCS